MRELIGRIAVTDSDAATALRVIAHFDDLADRGASSSTLLRAAAGLANGPVGMHDGATGRSSRFDPPGSITSPPTDPDSSWPREVVDKARAISIWLERSGEPGPLDQLILERCAHALRAARGSAGRAASIQELVHVVCDGDASASEREEALTKLQLSEPVTVQVGYAPPSADGPSAPVDGYWVTLRPADGSEREQRTVTLRGSATALNGGVPTALQNARLALRLAVHRDHGGPTQVTYEDLGALADLARVVTAATAQSTAEVQAMESLRKARAWVPQILHQVATGATLRGAAQALHLHHSTMQDREAWLESKLGYEVRAPQNRERITIAWLMWRISGYLQAPSR